MIVQTSMVLLIFTVISIRDVTSTSFSNVYVESEVVPRGYYTYGAPYPSRGNPTLSQINSLPSVPGYVTPCVSPCAYPTQTVATVTPVNPSPNVIAYNAKNVPVIVAPTKQEATGYEYSYIVYDENTGDQKAQREHSDGSVVKGEYSFLQPDGYIRDVHYVADDISGFNAVVKQFLPAPVEGKKKVEDHEKKESTPPCHDTKNESFKEISEDDSGEISIKQLKKIHDILYSKHSNEESAEKSKGHLHTKPKESEGEEHSKDKHHHKETKKGSKEASGESSEENSKEKHHDKSKKISNEHSVEQSEEKHHKKSKQESKESEQESGEESDSEESKEELKEKPHKKSSKETEGSKEKHKSKKESDENSEAESEEKVSHGKNKEVHELLEHTDETLIPYKDILKCIEAAMKRNHGVPVAMRQGPTPLTYIVLNKPC